MEPPETEPRYARGDGGPFQFSLRTIFIVMTVMAVTLSGIFAGPAWLVFLTAVLFIIAVPIVLTVALIYGRGYGRTFCIGALFPAGVTLFFSQTFYFYAVERGGLGPGRDELALVVGIFLVISCIAILGGGLLAMGVRWMVEQSVRPRYWEVPRRAETPIKQRKFLMGTESGASDLGTQDGQS